MLRALFPGTFDPIHYGHIDIANRASRMFDELIIAVYDRPLKNLVFSPEERIRLAKLSFADNSKISVVGYQILTVEFCRKVNAQVIVRGLRVFSDFELEFRMALANRRLAPDIEMIALMTSEDHTFLSSSTVREISVLGGDVTSMVPPFVDSALKKVFLNMGENMQSQHINSLND